MRVLTSKADLRAVRRSTPGTWGLVPTMGYLHGGHLSLVQRARQENEWVGVSIFVNPTQFGPQEDLSTYPRNLERDLALLQKAGVDVIWTPPVEEVYPPGFQTYVMVEEVTRPLEGAARPRHFRGVATVVAKLLHVFQPDQAYFGQKDAQQVAVIRQMVQDLDFDVELVVCPTMREADGLAMSSRNAYLKPDERQAATMLYRALMAAGEVYHSGERNAERLRQAMKEVLACEPLARPEYVSVADPTTLIELDRVGPAGALFSMAVRIGRTRLIDNIIVGG